jgi:hypothetical protein
VVPRNRKVHIVTTGLGALVAFTPATSLDTKFCDLSELVQEFALYDLRHKQC